MHPGEGHPAAVGEALVVGCVQGSVPTDLGLKTIGSERPESPKAHQQELPYRESGRSGFNSPGVPGGLLSADRGRQ
jgi:hypothetical protein